MQIHTALVINRREAVRITWFLCSIDRMQAVELTTITTIPPHDKYEIFSPNSASSAMHSALAVQGTSVR